MQMGELISDRDLGRIHISDIMKQMRDGERYEIKDVCIGREKKLKTRLILYKLTKEQLKKRSENRTVSMSALWETYFTSLELYCNV